MSSNWCTELHITAKKGQYQSCYSSWACKIHLWSVLQTTDFYLFLLLFYVIQSPCFRLDIKKYLVKFWKRLKCSLHKTLTFSTFFSSWQKAENHSAISPTLKDVLNSIIMHINTKFVFHFYGFTIDRCSK